jgi:pyruvate formate lyase activating enzyme
LAPQFGGAMQAHAGQVIPDRAKSVPLVLAGVCPSLAIRVAGKHIEIDDLMTQLVCDQPYFTKSGGGVTFSGGEPLNQPEFVAECVTRLADVGISSAIETCLAVERKNVELLLPLPVYWLVDVKHVDEEKFLQETGGHVEDVLSNIALVARSARSITFRIPLIPGFNHSDEDRKRIFDFIASLERAEDGPPRVDILPCHDLAAGKYMQLGRPNPFKAIPRPSDHLVNEWKSEAKRYGFTTDIGG